MLGPVAEVDDHLARRVAVVPQIGSLSAGLTAEENDREAARVPTIGGRAA
jgi:hypothetical protein